jgi:hypothetical protein
VTAFRAIRKHFRGKLTICCVDDVLRRYELMVGHRRAVGLFCGLAGV